MSELMRKRSSSKDGGPVSAAEMEEESRLRASIADRIRAIGCPAGYGAREARDDSNRLHQLHCKRLSLEPVFQAMLANAVRVCGAKFGAMYRSEGSAFRVVAMHNAPSAFAEFRRCNPVFRPNPRIALGRGCDETNSSNRGCASRTGLLRSAARLQQLADGHARRRTNRACRPDAEGKRVGRCDRHLPPGGQPLH